MNQTMDRIAGMVYIGLLSLEPGGPRVKAVQRIGHRYAIETNEHVVRAVYRGTTVAILTTDTIQLSTGGWHTPTTKNVINAALAGTPYSLVQRMYVWYIHDARADTDIRFYEGIILHA